MSREALPDVDGHKCWLMKMEMPPMISNRSLVNTYYHSERPDGTIVFLNSSQGNDSMHEQLADKIGSDVIANNICTQTSYKPCEDGVGVHLTVLVSVDVAGMIPGFIKNKIAGRLANMGLIVVDYLKDGTVPEAVF